jgi:hypothetical protein
MAEQQKPPLEDPLEERGIFVSDVAGIAFVHGNFVITLADFRPQESVRGQPPQMRRVVVGRVALTNIAAGQLLVQLQQMAAQIEAAASAAIGHKPN